MSNSPGDGVATLAQRLRDFPTEEDCGDPECGSCDFTRLCHSLAARVEALAASEQALRERVAELEQSLSKERRLYTAQVLLTTDLRTRLAAAVELCDELRSYTHDWDWKYGEEWDKARAALTPAPTSEGSR